jgi:hypothetical protein
VQPLTALKRDENVELLGLRQRGDVTTPRLCMSSGKACGNRFAEVGRPAPVRAYERS